MKLQHVGQERRTLVLGNELQKAKQNRYAANNSKKVQTKDRRAHKVI